MLAIPPPRLSDPGAAVIARAILAAHAGDGPLEPWISKVLLAAYGVPVSRERLVRSRIDAIEAAMEDVGFPCVLEHGAVRHGGLTDAEAVGAAYDRIGAGAGAWLREAVPETARTRIRLTVAGDAHRMECDAVSSPKLAAILVRLAELTQDLAEEIAVIELDPVILLPDRIVALSASIIPRRGNA